jgi:hypothetical protein
MTTEIVDQRAMMVNFYDSEGQVLYSCRKTNPRFAPSHTPSLRGSN